MTKKISFALAVALLLILFNSCRQEFLTQENENQKNLNNYKVYTIDKKQITTDFKLFDKIAKLQNIFSQRMETGKSVQDSILDGAIIGINKVLVVEENGVKSYTFPLKRIFPNGKIENLVLKRNSDSTFSGILIQYNITEQEKELFNDWHSIDLKSKIKTYNIRKLAIKTNAKQVSETTNDGCTTVTYDDGMCTAGGGHYYGQSCNGNASQQPRPPHVLSIVQDPNCGDTSGSNGGGSGGSVGSNPGGNTGGGGQNPKPGSNPPQGDPEPSNGGGSIDTMPFTDADFNYYSSNDLADPAFQFYSQVSQFMLTQPQKVKDLNALNQYFFYFTYNYFTTNEINPTTKAFLSERLQLIANWYYQQNNYGQFAYGNQLNDNDRNTFSFWVYNYLVNHNPTAIDYFKNNMSDLELIYMKVSNNESVNYANTTADKILSILIANSQNSVFNSDKKQFFNGLYEYFFINNGSLEAQNFITWALQFKLDNSDVSWTQFENMVLYNKNLFENSALTSVDENNNIDGGYDTTIYSTFNPQQQIWPTIANVIPLNSFVGWGYPGVKRNCMDYAKAQIGKKGYQISNYGVNGQTIQIYREQTGVNNSNLIAGLSYLKYALSNGIPVIVGVHDAPGHPGNADQSTDHFIVIVGMGSNSNGNYFSFYDNASGNSNIGASPNNKLYYDSSTGLISGTSDAPYANGLTYVLTQIRKSKLK